jgi:2-methylcitrate dehydratase PrpD
MTAARRIAAWSRSLELEDVPDDVREHAKLHLLDALGCGLAASALGVASEGRAAMAEQGGTEEAAVIGLPVRLPAANAAFANAMLCHGLDFDDTHSDSVSHVTTVVGPAALAAAEAHGAGGRDALAAVVAGNEVVTRIGMAAPGAFHARGFHPTAICGIFGATVAAARLGGIDPEETASALGIAGSLAAGIFAFLADGTDTKPVHPAWAAHGGLLAARLAQLGAAGPPSVLEGKFGVYHAFLAAAEGEVEIAGQLADLGERWETPRIAFKPYPACHFMHGALGAIAEATAGRTFTPDEIEEVVVAVPAAGVSLVLEPAESKVAPRTEYEGKFSLQYSAAAMLVTGVVGVASYTDEAIADPAVLEVARKVRYETRDYPTYPGAFPGGARIRLAGGSVLEADRLYQAGSPERPLSPADVRAKFRENASLALPAASVDALEDAVLALEREPDLGAALAPLAEARSPQEVARR